MKALLACFLFSVIPFSVSALVGSISSKNASYNGDVLALRGDIAIEHELGDMRAQEAFLYRGASEGTFPFTRIDLKKSVVIKLDKGGELECEVASFNLRDFKGKLASSDRVTYQVPVSCKGKMKYPFHLQGQSIEVSFIPYEQQGSWAINFNKREFFLKSMLIRGKAECRFGEELGLSTDALLYEQGDRLSYAKLRSCGDHATLLSYRDDLIEADQFDFDTSSGQLHMVNPKGTFTLGKKVSFIANELILEKSDYRGELADKVTLMGNILISDPMYLGGNLYSDREVVFFRKGKKIIDFKGIGTNRFSYEGRGCLLSHGTFHLDVEAQTATLESPVIDDKVSPGLQLYYEEEGIGIYADRGRIDYTTEGEEGLKPVSFSLKGGVRLCLLPKEEKQRVGIADRLYYSPLTHTLILSADPRKKVIFIDYKTNMRVTADEVHLIHDGTTEGGMVRGVGNVELALVADKEMEMKKYFKFFG